LYEKQQKQETIMRTFLLFIGLMLVISRPAIAGPLFDSLSDEKRSLIRALIQDHFLDSTLSEDEQAEELAWFAHAAMELKGTEISVLS
jgi:glycerol transport system substrate-binding protein